MKRKAKQYSKFQPVFLLSHAQRTALWIALDTLAFVKPSIRLGKDAIVADDTSSKLSKLDDTDGQAKIEMSYAEVIASAKALELAAAYLDGKSDDYCTSDLLISRLPQELREYGPLIRSLRPLFKECVDAILKSM